ncbi:MAG: cache domain-containing protein, partial [Bacilli bacterium]
MFRINNSFINRLKGKKWLSKKGVWGVTGIVLAIILSILTSFTYREYEKTIVSQQQQNMLGISRSISRSIELFINHIVDSMKVITLDEEFVEMITHNENEEVMKGYNKKLKAYYEAEKESIAGIYFFDSSGKTITQYPNDKVTTKSNLQSNIDYVVASKKPYIANPYFDEAKRVFILNIYEPVFQGETFKGVLAVKISLDVIYDKLINPVKIGEKGYALVKDQYGIIIMHTVKEQVGMDVIETRKQVYPDLDFKELENLINHQLTGEEGTAIYHSYWWGESSLKRAKKLNAYTPVQLGEYFWVVALTMSYDEIQGPVNKFLGQIIGIAIVVTIIILIFALALAKMKKNKEELEKETKYLKMLNEASEELREKESEIYHSHKLKMVGTLAGGIAHDINNLLTPILGYSELLMMRLPKDSEYYEEVDEIHKASEKGKDLIQQILAFSRNDKGIVKVEAIDINEVTKETIKLVKAVIPKNIEIKEYIQENCGYINASFTQIHQVIFNLCTNAYQSIKNKKGLIEISLNTVDNSKVDELSKSLKKELNYVKLVIKDNGCGMDEETKAQIFNPFFTTKTIGEGTGLGLFVVQNIIDKYDGYITVESEIGNGSSFEIYF